MQTPLQLKGNIHHDVADWPFRVPRDKNGLGTREDEPMPLSTIELAAGLKKMGINAIELAPQDTYAALANMGMKNVMGLVDSFPGTPQFIRGFNNPAYRPRVVEATIAEIDLLAEYSWPNVIAFVGFREDPADRDAPIKRSKAFANCVAGLRKVAKHAEAKRVTVCLEHLNTRDTTHPMKGHPGYQGDDLDFVARIIREVNSPNVKLLFDCYHVQVMHGDLIRRISENMDIIGHVHTAGCPDRAEIGDDQEINYPAVMRELVRLKYTGRVGVEHIPVWDDKFESIAHSISICDV